MDFRNNLIRVFLSNFLLAFAFSLNLIAQTTELKPSPTEKSSADQAKKDNQNIFNDDEVINVNTTLVDIPVSVYDKDGRVITNLVKNDFHIYENGVEQQIDNFASVEKPFTVVLLLDVSGSMRYNIDGIKKAALAFIDQLKSADRVIAITFDRQVRILSTDVLDREKLRKAIKEIEPGGGTFLYSVVEAVSRRLLRRFPGRKALILFTDGVDDWRRVQDAGALPRSTYEASLREAETSNALIYCVQFTPDIGTNIKEANSYLSSLAERTGGRLYRPRKIKELEPAFVAIAEELRWQYSLGYYPGKTALPNERRQIKVVVNQSDAKVRARESYVGKPK
jgi:Ca-activated chloride channel family protein